MRGSSGEAVRDLQQMLMDMYILNDKADGVFGAKTETAVMAYQQQAGLGADGIVWPQTLDQLILDWQRAMGYAPAPSESPALRSVCRIYREANGAEYIRTAIIIVESPIWRLPFRTLRAMATRSGRINRFGCCGKRSWIRFTANGYRLYQQRSRMRLSLHRRPTRATWRFARRCFSGSTTMKQPRCTLIRFWIVSVRCSAICFMVNNNKIGMGVNHEKKAILVLSLLMLVLCISVLAESTEWNYDANYCIPAVMTAQAATWSCLRKSTASRWTIGISVFKGDTITSLTLPETVLELRATPSPHAKIWPALRCPRVLWSSTA